MSNTLKSLLKILNWTFLISPAFAYADQPQLQNSKTTQAEHISIACKVIAIADPSKLDESALPAAGLSLKSSSAPVPHFDQFTALIAKFNDTGEPLIDQIFSPLVGKRQYAINVILTQAIPEPYDAWTGIYQGKPAFFFNMDMWNKASLEKNGMGVIKHEAAHVLLRDLLKMPDQRDSIAVLNHIVINEGIAHFIGYSKNRERLLIERKSEWLAAESSLAAAVAQLSDIKTTELVRNDLLKKATTGAFWQKYGAIAGMFRAASIYQKQGPEGLITAVQAGKLPKTN